MSVEERLQEIADRIVEFRTRDAKVDVARRLVETTGSASAEEIAAALGEWTPPEGPALADLVARKAAAAVDVATAEYERRVAARAGAAAKAEKLRAQAEEAQRLADEDVDDAEVIAAKELLDAALAAGGDPARAPVGRSISTTPQPAGQ